MEEFCVYLFCCPLDDGLLSLPMLLLSDSPNLTWVSFLV
jgi:hypothetical protein